VCIVNDSGEEVSDRTEGFLWFRGPSATRGYFNNPEATEKLFPRGPAKDGSFAWVNSGDRAYRADGEIYVTGRVKDIIIKSGRNLYPHEVEELAGRAEGIRKGCIVAFGLKDEGTGTEKLIVVAESANPMPPPFKIAAAVTQQIRKVLAFRRSCRTDSSGSIPKTPAVNCAAKKPSSFTLLAGSPQKNLLPGCKSPASAPPAPRAPLAAP